MRKLDPLRLHGAGVEARDVEQRGEDLLDRVERGVDVLRERRIAGVAVALDQRGRVEARGVERLQDVVARRGEEAGLRDVGLVGLGLGMRRAPR